MLVRTIRHGGFCRINETFLNATGFTGEELASAPLADWLVEEDRAVFEAALEGQAEECRVRHRTRDGGEIELEVRFREHGEEAVVLARSTSASQRSNGSAEPTVKGTLHQIATIVEEQNPGYKCSILLVSHGRFVKGAGPSLPDDYNNAIDGFAIGPTVGACGTAIYWGVPVIVEDIQKDPLWEPFAELAKTAGVAACWSHPFMNNEGRVLGALALYSPEPRKPTEEQISRLRAAAQMTGLAVERGRAEEELRSANAIKARFMANMSHEIRTPLNALIGITDFLQSIEEGSSKGEISLLRESSEQLLELFTGVMELTEGQDRREEGKVLHLRKSCETVLEPFRKCAESKGLTFELQVADNVPQWLRLDDWAWERTLRLVVDNAVKFTRQGSVRVAVHAEGQELQVRVDDTGCGLPLDRLDELRQPFVQGDLSTTKEHAGFGLGLALSDLCIDALGGELQFASNETGGTEVRFSLPLITAKAPANVEPEAPMPRSVDAPELPVLVVEDNLLNSRVIAKILERSGYRCHITENGEEALRAMSEENYACILMDCQMPVMDGYEATRRIRRLERENGAHVPIIAVTANALAHDRDLCLEAGMDDYLKKPVRQQELVSALKSYLGQVEASEN